MTRLLEWIGVGGVVELWMQALGPQLDRRFGTRSILGAPLPICNDWLDPARRQLRADSILDALIDRYDAEVGGEERWLLGITDQDLYAPDRPYVFGEATVGGCCALVSLMRLQPGSPRFQGRLLATATHELAHVAGLEHCNDPGCVMWASHDVQDTDRKGDIFCAACTRILIQLPATPRA